MTETATQQPPTQDDETGDGRDGSWLDADVDGRSVRSWIVVGLAIAAVTLGFGAWWTYGLDRGTTMTGQDMAGQQMGGQQMGGGEMSPDAPRLPPVFAYHDGQPIAFVHPEASDPEIAQVLSGMMGSPVLTVPSLADVPDDATGAVYVFTNGITPTDTPAGPLGFQPDVFESAPGDLDYTPLRRIVEVAWTDASQARLLTSTGAIQRAADRGLVELTTTDVVVNAPVLTWPGGQR